MAVLAVGAAGAAIGAGIGAAAGATTFAAIASAAALGWSVGTLLGNMLFPKKTHNEGARLNDLAITSSTFGAVIPIGYGRSRISGNVIWALPLREQAADEHAGKKGGKGGATTTNYTYFSSFALALCEGPVSAVLRIWADNKLVYDTTSGTDAIKKVGFTFRFYPGDETQLPDSIIEADKGVGNVSANRGLCYLVFDDIPVADFGNRLPNIQAEVAFVSAPDYDYEVVDLLYPSIFGGVYPYMIMVNYTTGFGYLQGSDPDGLIVFDTNSMQVILEKPMSEILTAGDDPGAAIGVGFNNFTIGPDQALYFGVPSRVVRVDPNTLEETAEYAGSPQFLATLSWFDAGIRRDVLIANTIIGSWSGHLIPDLTLMDKESDTVSGGSTRASVAGTIANGFGEAWYININGGDLYLNKISNGFGLSLAGTQEAHFVPTDLDAAATLFGTGTYTLLLYDWADACLVFSCQTMIDIAHVSKNLLIKWSPDSGVVWTTELPNAISSQVSSESLSINGNMALWLTGHVVQFDLSTGLTVLDQTAGSLVTQWPIGITNSQQLYNSFSQATYGYFNDGLAPGWAKARLNRAQGTPTTLGDIVGDLCTRAGFTGADFDTSELTDVVQGFIISQRTTVVDILGPLFGTYLVDGVETDYVLDFHHRDSDAAIATVAEDDLIRVKSDTAEPYSEVRQQEVELPMRVTLTYSDFDRDYQNNTQSAKRSRNPDPTVFSDTQADIDLAIVATATPVKQMVEKILYSAWNERHTFQVRLPPQYAYLDPADVVTLTLNDGYTARMRVGSTALGVDYTLDTKLIGETDGQYVSTSVPVQGVPWAPSHTLDVFAQTRLVLLDVPLLRDFDDTGGRGIRGYWAAGPQSDTGTWPGAVLQQATDLSTWVTLDVTSQEATTGYLVTPPDDTTALFATQYSGTMTVAVLSGTFVPSTVTDFALANGANPIALIKPNGEVEILQYRDATTLGSGQYALSVLRRAQRGTDTMANGHSAGETIVFLSTTSVESLVLPIGQFNFAEFYRGVTNGTIAQIASVNSFTYHARDLMPYAPVDFMRAPSSSPPDVVVTWKRRTRIGGLQQDGVDTVPLSETSEAYEAYVIASAGAFTTFDPASASTYLRAYTGLSSATLTYNAAEQAADGFVEATDTLYLVIYQVSSVVGRGFPGYQALPAF